jgi:hypothetical protein
MEPEGSLPCSQEPVTGPYPESDQSSPYHLILFKINFNIILPLRLGLPITVAARSKAWTVFARSNTEVVG